MQYETKTKIGLLLLLFSLSVELCGTGRPKVEICCWHILKSLPGSSRPLLDLASIPISRALFHTHTVLYTRPSFCFLHNLGTFVQPFQYSLLVATEFLLLFCGSSLHQTACPLATVGFPLYWFRQREAFGGLVAAAVASQCLLQLSFPLPLEQISWLHAHCHCPGRSYTRRLAVGAHGSFHTYLGNELERREIERRRGNNNTSRRRSWRPQNVHKPVTRAPVERLRGGRLLIGSVCSNCSQLLGQTKVSLPHSALSLPH